MKDYSYYLNQFLENVGLTEQTQYESRGSVRNHNRATDRYRAAARTIGEAFPEKIDEFAGLLESDRVAFRLCCAVCLVELMPSAPSLKVKAISRIKIEMENGNATPEYGWKIWMKSHEREAFLID